MTESRSTPPDNPSAFPEVYTDEKWSETQRAFRRDTYSAGGMTLRDYFAAAALQGILTNGSGGWDRYQERAESAYGHADAMLKERVK